MTFAKFAIVLGLLLALVLGIKTGVHQIDQRGFNRAKAEATAALEKQKREAGQVLAAEKAKTHAAEQLLREFKNNQDIQDAKHQTKVDDLSRRVRQLSGQSGRLRDPHAPGCGGGSGGTTGEAVAPPGSGAADPGETGGLLSVPLTELLGRALREADAINIAYISCRADAYTIRAAQP